MKIGTILSIVIATLAISGMVVAFLSNASPYVTIAQAKEGGQGVHVVGELVKDSVKNDIRNGLVEFTLISEQGEKLPIRYKGNPISNLTNADRVVVVGGLNGQTFDAEKVLVKCPSKYEGEEKAAKEAQQAAY